MAKKFHNTVTKFYATVTSSGFILDTVRTFQMLFQPVVRLVEKLFMWEEPGMLVH